MLVPHDERPPHRDGEQLRHDLRQVRLLRERPDEVHAREKQQDHGEGGARDARDVARQQPQRDEKDEAGLERDGRRHRRIDRVQRVAPDPRARQHRQQVAARGVVDHLSQVFAERDVVDEPPVPLDVFEEREMVREVGAAAGRQKIGTREPQEPREGAERPRPRSRTARRRRAPPAGAGRRTRPPPRPATGSGSGRARSEDRPQSARYAKVIAEARRATSDAATASASMSGIAKQLIIPIEAPDVHRPFRSGLRREEGGAGRVARLAVSRLPVRRPVVADAPPARHRASRSRAGRDRDDAARFRELSVLPQPARVVRVGPRRPASCTRWSGGRAGWPR